MYGRSIDGKSLTLEASGRLYRDALVLVDRESDTLWTQENGKAVKGKLLGQTLEPIPGGVTTTWARWKAAHPDTRVLKKNIKESGKQKESVYADYFANPDKVGVLGSSLKDRRLPPKSTVFGLAVAGHARAYPAKKIRGLLVRESLGGKRLLLAYSQKLDTLFAYGDPGGSESPKINGNRIQEGPESWDLSTGKALAGTADDLKPLPVIRSFWYVWVRFHPKTEIWKK